MKSTLNIRTYPNSSRVDVVRCSQAYPNGTLVAKFKGIDSAVNHALRQTAEDAATRLRHVTEYLAERAARPAPVVEPTNQLDLF